MMKHLYIIGNGFDLHHNIRSGFKHYAEWLEKTHEDIYIDIENVYQITDVELWKDFEHLLGELDILYHTNRITGDRYPTHKQLIDGDDRDFDEYMRIYEGSSEEARGELEELFNRIRCSFTEWVEQLEEPDEEQQLPIVREDSFFVTFNYTDTLETLYHIPQDRILYIHGCAHRGGELILGHGLSSTDIRSKNVVEPPADADTPEKLEEFYKRQGDVIIDETFEELCRQLSEQEKPVDRLLKHLANTLPTCNELEMIHIYGLSFSDIDMPYIELIKSKVDLNSVLWEVSYFGADEAKQFENVLCDIGVPREKIKVKTLENIKRHFGCKRLF